MLMNILEHCQEFIAKISQAELKNLDFLIFQDECFFNSNTEAHM